MSRYLNDVSADAPKLRVYLNLDNLKELGPRSCWPGLEGRARYERLAADGFEGVQLTDDAPSPSDGPLPHCGLDRINTPAEAATVAAKRRLGPPRRGIRPLRASPALPVPRPRVLRRAARAESSQATAPTPFMVANGKDRGDHPLFLFEGDTFYTKVSGKDTGGGLYIFESTRIKSGGPAEHVHPEQDEWWYILAGRYIIKVGDTRYEVGPGDSAFGPRSIPHVWAKISEEPGTLLIGFQPVGGMEEFFRAVSEGSFAKLSPAEQEQFRRSHGFIRTGAALSYHKQ